jgi:hypothetical protein
MLKTYFPASEYSSHPYLLVATIIIVFILVVMRTYYVGVESIHVKSC